MIITPFVRTYRPNLTLKHDDLHLLLVLSTPVVLGHNDSVTCVEFAPSGNYVATGDMAGDVKIWLRPTTSTSADAWSLIHSITVGDLLWLRWWEQTQKPAKSVAATASPPAVLILGDEDGLVTMQFVTTAMMSPSAPSALMRSKCIAGRWNLFSINRCYATMRPEFSLASK